MLFLGWAPDYADPDDYVVPFLRSGGFFPGRIAYSNASLDALVDRQTFERNPLTRLDLLRQIQFSAYADVPYLWQVQGGALHVYRAWVIGYYTNPMLLAPPYAALSK
jgi:peptide/nickel transport system substrate-binding protein